MTTSSQKIYAEILRVAKNKGMTFYSDIAPLAGLNMGMASDRSRIANILDSISTAEHRSGRPLLSAVVILKEENIPGQGFFSLAKRLGLYDGSDDTQYWTEEVRRVHDY